MVLILGNAYGDFSTITMWRAYLHNNKYGPFVDPLRKGRGVETAWLELETGIRDA